MKKLLIIFVSLISCLNALAQEFSFEMIEDKVKTNQSAVCYGDYLLLIGNYMSRIQIYDLKERELIGTAEFEKRELMRGSNVVYHANQSSFGPDKYSSSDEFPLLYISQRAPSNNIGGFVEVYRIIPTQYDEKNRMKDCSLQLVQHIQLPAMDVDNCMGNPNAIIDPDKRLLYVYGRYLKGPAKNMDEGKITCFTLPKVKNFWGMTRRLVNLTMLDAIDSFAVGKSLVNAQGGMMHNGKLYIAVGIPKNENVCLNIYDPLTRTMERQINMWSEGFKWEPEGVWMYDGDIMVSTSVSKLFKLKIF